MKGHSVGNRMGGDMTSHSVGNAASAEDVGREDVGSGMDSGGMDSDGMDSDGMDSGQGSSTTGGMSTQRQKKHKSARSFGLVNPWGGGNGDEKGDDDRDSLGLGLEKGEPGSRRRLYESAGVGTLACPVDCALSSWGGFSPCSRTCIGHGTEVATRQRLIVHDPSHGGTSCGPTEQTKECPLVQCGECACCYAAFVIRLLVVSFD